MKRTIMALLALLVVGAEGAAEKSPSLWRTRKELSEAKEKEKALAAQKRQKAQEERKTLSELERLDKKAAAVRAELRAYEEEIGATNAQIMATRRRHELTAGQVDASKERLKGFLQAWRQGEPEGLQAQVALWCASAEAGRLSSARLSKFHLRQRADMLGEYRVRQEVLKRNIAGKKKELETTIGQRRSFLKRVRASKERTERLLAETQASRQEFERLVEEIAERQRRAARAEVARAAGLPSGTFVGRLIRPVEGRLLRRYGRQRHKEFNAVVYCSGIEVAAEPGAPVRAAARGRVVHRGWLKGYGRVMIVDHGGDLYTVYGHLQDFRAQEKQQVAEGAVIATAGDTGSLGGVSLYFEVRVKGQAKDPQLYLKRQYS